MGAVILVVVSLLSVLTYGLVAAYVLSWVDATYGVLSWPYSQWLGFYLLFRVVSSNMWRAAKDPKTTVEIFALVVSEWFVLGTSWGLAWFWAWATGVL